ncbi:NTP transferase domain-containing protein [Microbispora bryophytorum]|uniref:NTP transferase domain-containing protein n=1 Tax=Microbispora bryophytorum TaxID=1460882 RepID=UPI0037166CD2
MIAILLAGGSGTRLGRDKATVRLGGETLLQRHMRQAARAGVHRFLVIANPGNLQQIKADVAATGYRDVKVCLQEGLTADGAALTGLRRVRTAGSVFVSGITDMVPDDTYERLAACPSPIAVTTAVLQSTFIGGMLTLGPDFRVTRIVERPAGGCPPGAWANIWVHRINGTRLVRELTATLADLGYYEVSMSVLFARGHQGMAVPVEQWVPIKTPETIHQAGARFGLAVHKEETTA